MKKSNGGASRFVGASNGREIEKANKYFNFSKKKKKK